MLSTYTLTNGLRIVHIPSPTQVGYCGYAIKAGTRNEFAHQQGIAHLVEHMLFKGTTHRRAWHILNRMENVGGDLNAYTNKEEMVVYAAFMIDHTERAIELLSDIVFNSTFPQHEMDKEVEVIIDEIQSYEDTPQELIYDDFEELIFPNHPLGKNILGKPEQLRTYKTIHTQQFTKQYYRPDNMIFFIKGNISFSRIIQWLEKYTAPIATSDEETVLPRAIDIPLPTYLPQTKTVKRNTHQAHVVIGGRAYNANNEKRTALYLLNNLLGGPGMNSRLNVSLREKRGLVYNVESNIINYTDTGVWCIYFGCDHDDADKCQELVRKELERLCKRRLTDSQLNMAKKQIIGQIGVSSDNFENQALDIAKVFLHYNRYDSQEKVFERIQALTSDMLLETANEMFIEENVSTLIYK